MSIQQPIGMYRNSPFEWISVKFDEFIILDLISISIWYYDYKQSFSTTSNMDHHLLRQKFVKYSQSWNMKTGVSSEIIFEK